MEDALDQIEKATDMVGGDLIRYGAIAVGVLVVWFLLSKLLRRNYLPSSPAAGEAELESPALSNGERGDPSSFDT